MNKLAKHLDENSINQADFAKMIGSSQSAVYRFAAGKLRPKLDLAFEIEKVTKGAVPASSWVSKPESDTAQ